MDILKKYSLHIIFIFVVVLSFYIRISQSIHFDFPFTYDQARDMLDIRVLGGFYDFKISGPTTSITGLNLGPFYYVFNLPAYWLGGGNPQFLVYWNILWFLLSGISIYAFFYKKNKPLAFFGSSIFLMAPQLFPVTRYFWNANSVVYFIVFYFLAFYRYVESRNKLNALLWGITSGLVIQFEAAFGIMCVAFSFFMIISNKKLPEIKTYLVGVIPWFFPQLVYELTHNFQMTKLFLGVMKGENTLLGEQLAFTEVLKLHWSSFTSFFEGQFMLPFGAGFILLIISLFVVIRSIKYSRLAKHFLGFIIFAFAFYSILYPHKLKPWYLEGIRVWYVFVVALAFSIVTKSNKIILIVLSLFLIRTFYMTAIDQSVYITDNGKSADPKNAQNIMRSIDWVYQQADGKGFTAYNYVPEIHDFSTNYMYWWYGKIRYGYIPEKISYSINPVPEYIRMENKFQSYARQSEKGNIALIYETLGNHQSWLSEFSDYCMVDKKTLEWNVGVEWRIKCKD